MNKKVLLLLLSVGLAAGATASAATGGHQAFLDTFRGRTDAPVPLSIVKPVVSEAYTGMNIDLVFSVDEFGRPGRIQSRHSVDGDLMRPLRDAIEQWQFKPALGRDGLPKRTKVLLPVHIITP